MTDRERKLLVLALVGAGLILIYSQREVIAATAEEVLAAGREALFTAALPSEARQYEDVIRRVATETGIDPLLLAAIGQYESRWGEALSPPGPSGTGDAGHGHGIMQIDDRTWGSWLASNQWWDPYTNVRKGAEIYLASEAYFVQKGLEGLALVKAALAGYNAGPGRVWAAVQAGKDPDTVTYRQKYGSTVLAYLASATRRYVDAGGGGGGVA